ncbi:MAG: hypothetical protein J6F30_06190 [Cellulosilyticum sp.]|nr:hypothetical protein [Cellulosilyticum sp.]
MTIAQFEQIELMRLRVKEKFNQGFSDAKNLPELLQVYASYTGNLEAIIDTVEVIEISKKVR